MNLLEEIRTIDPHAYLGHSTWVKEWDGKTSIVDPIEFYPSIMSINKMVVMRYLLDGLTHIVTKKYFDSISCGIATDADFRPTPVQCWSPKLR